MSKGTIHTKTLRPAFPAWTLIAVLLATPAFAATEFLPGLQPGLALARGLAEMQARCETVRRVDVTPPSFPLAQKQETHLVCERYTHQGLEFERLALTFADDRLELVYAEGNVQAIGGLATVPLQKYLHFQASFEDLIVIDPEADRAWLMSPEAAHPNLFMWPNPYLDEGAAPQYASSADASELLRFGDTLESLEPVFDEKCGFSHLDSYGVWLLTSPELQQQIDCFNYEFAGFPRKVEAVFGDGILEQAWILTAKGEEQRVRQALTESFGAPVYVDEEWEIFDDGTVMLRKDKPEVLMLSKELAPLYRAEYIDES